MRESKMSKPILCLDFDGVHSYTSGWKGADVIPDPPVPGMIDFLEQAMQYFDIQVFSSRSRQIGQISGTEAMTQWLIKHVMQHFEYDRALAVLRGVRFVITSRQPFSRSTIAL
jgi:hypothetical protein